MLQTPTGPFAPAEIDTAAFTALDTTFPWNLSHSEDKDANRLDVIDKLLQGFPIDYGPNTAGLITARVWSPPTGSSTHKMIKPLDHPDIERIDPLGEITLKGDSWEVVREDSTIKTNYPGSRTESFTVALDNQLDAAVLGDDRLARFNRPFDRLEYPVGLALFGLDLGDEVPVTFRIPATSRVSTAASRGSRGGCAGRRQWRSGCERVFESPIGHAELG